MVKVRPARPQDAELIVESQVLMAYETERLRLDRQAVSQGVRAVFDDPVKGRYWLAERDGRIVGVTMTTPEWSEWKNGTVLWIQSVYIWPEFRGQGAFKAIYTTLKRQVLDDDTLVGLRLYVDKRNTSAQRVYERLGMDKDHYVTYEWMKR